MIEAATARALGRTSRPWATFVSGGDVDERTWPSDFADATSASPSEESPIFSGDSRSSAAVNDSGRDERESR